jgi:spermidine synthase
LERSKIPINIVLGDARLKLQREPDKKYDLIVIDAFGSDAIPVHLITKEAVELYKRKLTDHGILLFHVSNENYRLSPVLANIAAEVGLKAINREFLEVTDEQFQQGLYPSHWVLMYRDPADVPPIPANTWTVLSPEPDRRPWTDDFSDVLSAVKWVK